jgi:hypothetical protein
VAIAVDPVAVRDKAISLPSSRSSIPISILEAWHLFSLDAPTVAALWSWFFARIVRIDLPWHAPLLLGLGTWLIYVIDRLLDGFRPGALNTPLKRRHRFHVRHARTFLCAAAVAGGVLVWLIRFRMASTARHQDTVLFFAAVLYFLVVHKSSAEPRSWLPKEMIVGIVFAAACAVPAWSRLSSGRIALLPAILLFAALCWLNCVAIERWENLLGNNSEAMADAHATTRWIANHFQETALILSSLSGMLAVLQMFFQANNSPSIAYICVACLTAALVLALIDRIHASMSPTALRIGADLALLTPLLCLPVLL